MPYELHLSDYCLVDHTGAPNERLDGMPGPQISRIPRRALFSFPLILPLSRIDRKMHFTGFRGALWRMFGVKRSTKNPNVCNVCAFHWEAGRLSEVTVLFADMRGFTRLTRERGPEFTMPLINQFFSEFRRIVTDHDGIVDRFQGDAALAFFNVPIRHDDHVQRAVAVASDVQKTVPQINEKLGQGEPLKVGVGVTSGLALTAHVGSDSCNDYTVLGDTVNLASRIQGAAGPGEVLVSEEVYARVRDSFPNAQRRELGLKGFDEPVPVYALERGAAVRPIGSA